MEEAIPFRELDDFNKLEPKNSFVLQSAFITGKLDAIKKYPHNQGVVFDRTIEEDREVFLQLHFALGFLTSNQLAELTNLSKQAELKIGRPNKKILLTANIETLKSRILNDRAHIRPAWLRESMSTQYFLYEAWALKNQENMTVIDTSKIKINEMEQLAIAVANSLKKTYDRF